jgi:hypothetical protein
VLQAGRYRSQFSAAIVQEKTKERTGAINEIGSRKLGKKGLKPQPALISLHQERVIQKPLIY